MAGIYIDQKLAGALSAEQRAQKLELCPFRAIEQDNDGGFTINAGCKMCRLCAKNDADHVFIWQDDDAPGIDKSEWKGIAVYAEVQGNAVHPVSLELLGKARELAGKVGFPVYVLLIGHKIETCASELCDYGADEVYAYEDKALGDLIIEPYTNVFEDFILKVKPSSILVGATAWGRSLAPRVAARLKTGLTADCTKLDIKPNTDLVQIRPAFGGNIMAQIITPCHRPQMATVRYKIFDRPQKREIPSGKVIPCTVKEEWLKSGCRLISVKKKERKPSISDAEVIVALGRGVKSPKDIELFGALAELLGGELACTRPLVESGWFDASRQIGLSGRTVKPKLIITLGISGAVQFKAGMENADLIISLNQDENAQIFDVCHYAAQGDIYEIVPKLVELIGKGGARDV